MLSLFRSLVIVLYEQQRTRKHGKKSLPEFQLKICRQPGGMITQFMSGWEPNTGSVAALDPRQSSAASRHVEWLRGYGTV